MNSTPNYGFQEDVKICGIREVDRELKRVEDKVDVNTIAIDNRYTKEELDCKLAQKASKCAFEKHLIDPNAHEDLFDKKVDKKEGCRLICEGELQEIYDALDDRYTKDEADTLFDQKVDRDKSITWYEPTFQEGFENKSVKYAKTNSGLVFLNGQFRQNPAGITNRETIFTLPQGFRPSKPYEVPVLCSTQSWSTFAHLNMNGQLNFAHGTPAALENDCALDIVFIAAQ